MKIVNISAYKFIDLENLEQLQDWIKTSCQNKGLKGTILLGHEGINLTLAGGRAAIDQWLTAFRADPRFADLAIKESYSGYVPFTKLKVKIKAEIIAMHQDNVRPLERTAPHLNPTEFKQMLAAGCAILDTRNDFEVAAGTFTQAINLNLNTFREFPEAIKTLDPNLKEQPLLIFCTGGIRCEKAAVALYDQGFKEVYQLSGGIIKYFEECGGEYYQGNCVVFDDRIAVNPQLEPINQ